MVPVENQLAAGQPAVQEQRRIQPATSRALEAEAELDYVELEERRQQEPLRQRRYLDEDEPRYDERPFEQPRFEEPRFEEPRFKEPKFEESRFPERRPENPRRPLQAEPLPRAPQRRPAPTPAREPVDVEAEDLADPW